ncbi:ornithine cyclodeaminase [Defluviimonas sp. WL0050]|uniref:Ornithine cyclodeaminase n=1 Tax=Albidovulum litorale TaxID=2984134 RepID=A0ABT2ZMP3_9RHOB|nr:ornithine cyclodeaminase [Defluviimonas sp. WL0050]MCV2872402.1 ornithine cyclodeaminase [Defluviimonas sp. WL0050]
MSIEIIGPEAEAKLDWLALTEALEAGHLLPKAEVGDTVLRRGDDTLLTRSAWIDGMGLAVKAATIYPGNQRFNVPNLHGAVALFADQTGIPEAYLDFALVTKWKTAADSLLSARRLARKDSATFLLVGAGTVAQSMVEAYSAAFPNARFHVWTRTDATAQAFAAATGATVEADLETAVAKADVIATATMATAPVIRGEWLKPGTHLDLIGAYRPDMREVDDEAMRRSRIFVDARATTIHHIGEIMDPIASGAITEGDILADFYDIAGGVYTRTSDDEITIAKNGGGAHLDLMTARYILNAAKS